MRLPVLFHLESSLHQDLPPVDEDPFIVGIQEEAGEDFVIKDDFSDYDKCPDKLVYIRTGGSEQTLLSLGLGGAVRLLTSGRDNSLAAAMEILSYVNSHGGKGEILHGTPAQIVGKLSVGFPDTRRIRVSEFIRPLPPLRLEGQRAGVIGMPSDWLIASTVDYSAARERLGLEIIDIPISELCSHIKRNCDLRSFKGSEAIYDAMREIVAQYALDGVTLRCFDLLKLIGNTGCLALARLNSEGIAASCEGDVPSLVTMMLAKKMTGCPGFQCNLSRISADGMLFAHCTAPLSMASSFRYTTHFESGIGTAIKAELPLGKVTVLKVSPDLERMVFIPAEIIRNLSEPNLCRTQVLVRASGADDYFLSQPLANHHVIVPGEIL